MYVSIYLYMKNQHLKIPSDGSIRVYYYGVVLVFVFGLFVLECFTCSDMRL